MRVEYDPSESNASEITTGAYDFELYLEQTLPDGTQHAETFTVEVVLVISDITFGSNSSQAD